jgi:hypothetical protein
MKRAQWLFCLLFSLAILAGAAGCGDDDHVNVFHATFTANDEHKDFTTEIGFTHFLTNSYDISYDKERHNPDGQRDYLLIDLPRNVVAGQVYDHHSSHVLLVYRDAEGNEFRSDGFDPVTNLSITVTIWEGVGGYGRGTFHAELKDVNGQNTVIIADGTFEGFIHND